MKLWSGIFLFILTISFLHGASSTNFTEKSFDESESNKGYIYTNEPLLFSTITRILGYDTIVSVGLDGVGDIYMLGITVDPYAPDYNRVDCFLFKINGTDFTQIYFKEFGGSDSDYATDMFVDPSGRVYITGYTYSDDFPMQNAYRHDNNGTIDCFIICFDVEPEKVLFSTYLGGDGLDRGNSIFVDDEGSIYVTGFTSSINFPKTSESNTTGVFYPEDVFVTKLNSTGNGLLYSSCIGGVRDDGGYTLTVDSQGNAYIAGFTMSYDFPIVNAYDSVPNMFDFSPYDGFVFCLNSTGNGLLFSTYMGGNRSEIFTDIELDSNGDVWVCGYTDSADFPTIDSFQNYSDVSESDCVIFKLSSNGSDLLFSTFFGGSWEDECRSMEFDERDNLFVAGMTSSVEFPWFRAAKSVYSENYPKDRRSEEGFVMKISPEESILYSTPVGGHVQDVVNSITVDENGAAIIGGITNSVDFPLRREFPYEPEFTVEPVFPNKTAFPKSPDGFVLMLLDISDEDGDTFPNWWEFVNGFDPLNPDAPLVELLMWYSPVIVMFGFIASIAIIVLWIGRHRIQSLKK